MNKRWNKFLFSEAIKILDPSPEKVIVELGASRDLKPVAEMADGWSTKKWANTSCEVHCVDPDPKAIAVSKQLAGDSVNYHCCGGMEFLNSFGKVIDLLYLDGPDADKNGQEFSAAALLAAPMNDYAVILIDDCDLWPSRWAGRGKGELALPIALELGFHVHKDNDRQVLLWRR